MNNETKHAYLIKLRNDGVYDIYVDDIHMCSKGSFKASSKNLKLLW